MPGQELAERTLDLWQASTVTSPC